ncbi:Eukaryotic translation initiation factor 3 subunit A [Yarrowia sp. C11]|nr:Eukaryotic translation initiation factor 3 subunit A [Yarrowia sp. C11]KAG5364116.1 Eukaryotic translation initiation factor 3 subunit A [Yarrowia sp. E02]
MAPHQNVRPETVLKRTDELIAVGQQDAALELLHETVSARKARTTSVATLEPIVARFVQLSVDLRKGKIIKDGLHQYKKIVQSTNVNAIEPVIKQFLSLAEQRVTDAQAQADKIADEEEADDLEAEESPEDLLLATVSSEDTKDRTDRRVVTPWLKFLWEAYRSVLDVLRNNSKLEVIYQQVVEQAFNFCLKFSRKTEFRRLCELLRSHLQTTAQKGPNAPPVTATSVDLSDADTLQRYLDTRFSQLNVAVKLELWQEAFRSVEDVHTLLTVSKRPAKPLMMGNYYENLARIFLVAGNYLFHAAAWNKLFHLLSQSPRGAVPVSEYQRVASFVLLSALAIPHNSSAEDRHRNTRLTGLLNLQRTPTRDTLLKSALSRNILAHVKPEIKALYKTLEVDFHPLSIRAKLTPVVGAIAEAAEFKPYFAPLYQVILTRLFQQLSQVYESVKLDFVIQLATFPAPFSATPLEIEQFIVRACAQGELAIKIDHDQRSVLFEEVRAATGSASLQDTPIEIVRTQLSRLGRTLSAVDPLNSAEAREQQYVAALTVAQDSAEREHAETLARRAEIEARKAQAEAERAQREEEETRKRAQRLLDEELAEKERLAAEQHARELERIRKEQEAIREEEKKKLAEEINAKGIITIDLDKLEGLDTNALRKMQVDQLAKETKELGDRLRVTARRIDHTERAYRMEEIKLVEDDFVKQKQRDREIYDARIKLIKDTAKAEHDAKVELAQRLQRAVPFYKSFRDDIRVKREAEFTRLREEAVKNLAEAKAARIEEVKAKRIADAKRAEEEARAAAEAEAKAKAEAEAKAKAEQDMREKLLAEKKAREEANARADAAYEKQRQKEAELEAKLEAKRAGGRAPIGGGGYVPPSRREGGGYVPPSRRGDAGAGPGAGPGAGAGSGYVPPSRREGGGGGYVPPSRREGGGGGYVPPSRREGGSGAGSGGRYIPPSQRN